MTTLDDERRATLKLVLDQVHDRFFKLEDVTFDAVDGSWRMPFGDEERGPYDQTMLIAGVEEQALRVRFEQPFYNVNTIKVRARRSQLVVKCDPMLDITLRVRPDWSVSIE